MLVAVVGWSSLKRYLGVIGCDGRRTEAQTASARTVGLLFQKILDFYMKIT